MARCSTPASTADGASVRACCSSPGSTASATTPTAPAPTRPPNQTRFFSGALGDKQLTANLDLSKQYKVGMMSGPLNVAVGAEIRRDGFNQKAGEPNSYLQGGIKARDGSIAPDGAQVF